MRLGAASPWEFDDDRYLHAYSQTSEEDITEEQSDDEEWLNYLFFLSIYAISMLRTILYSLVSTLYLYFSISALRAHTNWLFRRCNTSLKCCVLRFCWRCSNMADECFNVAHKMCEYY